MVARANLATENAPLSIPALAAHLSTNFDYSLRPVPTTDRLLDPTQLSRVETSEGVVWLYDQQFALPNKSWDGLQFIQPEHRAEALAQYLITDPTSLKQLGILASENSSVPQALAPEEQEIVRQWVAEQETMKSSDGGQATEAETSPGTTLLERVREAIFKDNMILQSSEGRGYPGRQFLGPRRTAELAINIFKYVCEGIPTFTEKPETIVMGEGDQPQEIVWEGTGYKLSLPYDIYKRLKTIGGELGRMFGEQQQTFVEATIEGVAQAMVYEPVIDREALKSHQQRILQKLTERKAKHDKFPGDDNNVHTFATQMLPTGLTPLKWPVYCWFEPASDGQSGVICAIKGVDWRKSDIEWGPDALGKKIKFFPVVISSAEAEDLFENGIGLLKTIDEQHPTSSFFA